MRAPTLISPHYLVLLALAGEMGHGLAIQRRIISDTTGIYLKPSMLYAAMKTLEADQ